MSLDLVAGSHFPNQAPSIFKSTFVSLKKANCEFLLSLEMFQGCGPCASPTQGEGGRRSLPAEGIGRQTGLSRYVHFILKQA